MFSVRWSTCWVRLAVRASDWVTENRCEHNLQLPPPAKQHHQSWQGLHWVAVQSLNRRVKGLDRHTVNISLFVCFIWSFILCMKSCWNPKGAQSADMWRFEGIEGMKASPPFSLPRYWGHSCTPDTWSPSVTLSRQERCRARSSYFSSASKTIGVHVHPLFLTKNISRVKEVGIVVEVPAAIKKKHQCYYGLPSLTPAGRKKCHICALEFSHDFHFFLCCYFPIPTWTRHWGDTPKQERHMRLGK